MEGLLALAGLQLLVLDVLQPVVQLPTGPRDFIWLQRVLQRRGVRLTSEQLAYQLQGKEVFEVGPLPLGPQGGADCSSGEERVDGEERGLCTALR